MRGQKQHIAKKCTACTGEAATCPPTWPPAEAGLSGRRPWQGGARGSCRDGPQPGAPAAPRGQQPCRRRARLQRGPPPALESGARVRLSRHPERWPHDGGHRRAGKWAGAAAGDRQGRGPQGRAIGGRSCRPASKRWNEAARGCSPSLPPRAVPQLQLRLCWLAQRRAAPRPQWAAASLLRLGAACWRPGQGGHAAELALRLAGPAAGRRPCLGSQPAPAAVLAAPAVRAAQAPPQAPGRGSPIALAAGRAAGTEAQALAGEGCRAAAAPAGVIAQAPVAGPASSAARQGREAGRSPAGRRRRHGGPLSAGPLRRPPPASRV